MAEETRAPAAAVVEAPAVGTERRERLRPFPFPDGAARHWLLSSIVWLTVVDLFGLVLATEFVTPEAFGGISWLQFSRVRPSHVNGVILAWLTMMYFGALFYMLPRLVGTRGMWSERLGIVCTWAWNAMYLLGVIGLLTGPLCLATDYAIGNVVWRPGHIWGTPPGALSSSLSDAMLNWWYAHNLFGLWLTPMLLALTYYIVPRITNTPLYSYTL